MLVSDEVEPVLGQYRAGLNPCFSGCWSRTGSWFVYPGRRQAEVLILVLVDVGLGLHFVDENGIDKT